MNRARLRLIIVLMVTALLGFVVWQNLQPAAFGVLGWRIKAPLAIWVAGAFALGFGTGWMACRRRA